MDRGLFFKDTVSVTWLAATSQINIPCKQKQSHQRVQLKDSWVLKEDHLCDDFNIRISPAHKHLNTSKMIYDHQIVEEDDDGVTNNKDVGGSDDSMDAVSDRARDDDCKPCPVLIPGDNEPG
ncbi:hypothetical protein H920_11892 [Fukomys damarensis]|uniref:Uncharacterized protein n=1 Tax=Fukomys damarensis TaxID=885580 RepID=A0A091D3W6_FUKDA|nr:hypothetical protein H920_11892 [Fukomys damarensis]